MAYTLLLNSSNVIGSNNNTYQYNFISGSFHAKDCEMAVSSLAIPYSWFNITSAYEFINGTNPTPRLFQFVFSNFSLIFAKYAFFEFFIDF